MNVIFVLIIILFITGIGYSIIRGFNLLSKKDFLSEIGYSYGLGVGLVTFQLFIYSRFAVPWNQYFLITPWIVWIFLVVILKRKNFYFTTPTFPKFKKIEVLFLIGILLAVAYTIFEAVLRPVSVWDAWAIWLNEAKVFFVHNDIDKNIFAHLQSDYPLVVKLLGTFVYLLLGQVDDTAVLLTSTAFYVSVSILFFSAVYRRFGLTNALLFTFLFVTIQNLIRHGGRFEAGLADLPLGYYAFASVTLLFEYIKKSSSRVLLLLTMLVGIMTLVKSEAIFIALYLECFVIFYILKHKNYHHLPYAILWALPFLDWRIYRQLNNLESYYFTAHPIEISLNKTINAFRGTFFELVNIRSWSLLWIVYFYFLMVFSIGKNREYFVINSIIILQLSVYMLTYIFMAGNAPESSIERLLIHIAPLAMFAIPLALLDSTKQFVLRGNFFKRIAKLFGS